MKQVQSECTLLEREDRRKSLENGLHLIRRAQPIESNEQVDVETLDRAALPDPVGTKSACFFPSALLEPEVAPVFDASRVLRRAPRQAIGHLEDALCVLPVPTLNGERSVERGVLEGREVVSTRLENAGG